MEDQGNNCGPLLAVMNEQEVLCRRLLEVTLREASAAADSSIDPLEDTTLAKRRLIDEMGVLESRRQDVAAVLLDCLGMPRYASLAELARGVGGHQGDALLATRSRLVSLAADLQEANEASMKMMHDMLDLTRDSLRHLRRVVGDGDSYTAEGRAAPAQGYTLVDRNA